MWKDSYRIGVDTVDEQHKALFDATEKLLSNLRNHQDTRKQECMSAIAFLKDYAVRHFADEEAYQVSIGYKDYAAHKKLHEDFVQTVLSHEEKMTKTDFDLRSIKEFTGMLVTWLTYHVAGIDQSITGEKTFAEKTFGTQLDNFHYSVRDVLQKLARVDADAIKATDKSDDDFSESISVEIEFTGDASGHVTYVYTKEFTKNVIYAMMQFVPDTVDELVYSALFEVSNIISGTVCTQMGRAGIFSDIKPPILSARPTVNLKERLVLDTGMGIIEIDFELSLV
ncbi:MAG: bacteriohemerythrin [Clostridiales bacterium]|jgi:hemerythrin|nr:bacteriohemerythrin [Clostridiales bacterium]